MSVYFQIMLVPEPQKTLVGSVLSCFGNPKSLGYLLLGKIGPFNIWSKNQKNVGPFLGVACKFFLFFYSILAKERNLHPFLWPVVFFDKKTPPPPRFIWYFYYLLSCVIGYHWRGFCLGFCLG